MSVACYPVSIPVRTAEPTFEQEPVSLAEAKRQCGDVLDSSYHDEDLRRMIVAARKQVEQEACLVCYTGSFTWKRTEFPCVDWFEIPSTLRPVTAVTAITYTATDGTTTTWSSSSYALDTSRIAPTVRLVYGESWPTTRGDISGISITATAGYSSVLLIPADVKAAVLLAVHIDWLFKMENAAMAMQQQQGYDRLIERLRRGLYS